MTLTSGGIVGIAGEAALSSLQSTDLLSQEDMAYRPLTKSAEQAIVEALTHSEKHAAILELMKLLVRGNSAAFSLYRSTMIADEAIAVLGSPRHFPEWAKSLDLPSNDSGGLGYTSEQVDYIGKIPIGLLRRFRDEVYADLFSRVEKLGLGDLQREVTPPHGRKRPLGEYLLRSVFANDTQHGGMNRYIGGLATH